MERVRAGNFAAIPRDLNFARSGELAHLIDGYDVAGGVTLCGHRYRRLLKRRRAHGQFRASALDLWLGLFFAIALAGIAALSRGAKNWRSSTNSRRRCARLC